MTAPIHCCYRGCMLTVWTPGDAGLEVNTSSATCLTCRRVALCLPHFATVTASRRGLRCAHCGAARWYVYLFEPARIDDGLRRAIEEAGGRVEARNIRRGSLGASGLRGWPGEAPASREPERATRATAGTDRGSTGDSGGRNASAPVGGSERAVEYGAPADASGGAKPRRSGPPPLPDRTDARRDARTRPPEPSAAARSALLLRGTPAEVARSRSPDRRAFNIGETFDGPGALPVSFAAEPHPEARNAPRVTRSAAASEPSAAGVAIERPASSTAASRSPQPSDRRRPGAGAVSPPARDGRDSPASGRTDALRGGSPTSSGSAAPSSPRDGRDSRASSLADTHRGGSSVSPGSAAPPSPGDALVAAHGERGSAPPPDASALRPGGSLPIGRARSEGAQADADAITADPILRPWSWLPARSVPPDATPAAPGVLLRRLGAAVRPIVDGVALDLTLPIIEAVSRAPGATGDLVIAGRTVDGAPRLTWMSAGGQRLDLPPPPGGRLSAPAFVDDHRFVYVAVVDDHAELREATIEGDSRLRTRRITALGAAPDGPHPPPAVFQHREAVVAFAACDGALRPVRIRLADGHATALDVAQPAPRRLVAAPRGSLAAWITAEGEVRCAGPGLSPRVLGQSDDDLLAIADDGAAIAWVAHGHLAVARPRSGDVQTRPLPEAIAALFWSPRSSRSLPKAG